MIFVFFRPSNEKNICRAWMLETDDTKCCVFNMGSEVEVINNKKHIWTHESICGRKIDFYNVTCKQIKI